MKISPKLFDISTDVAGDIPFEIINSWLASDKSEKAAKRILSPTMVVGTLVSSDTAGLSKMCRLRELIEILSIINRPKEILYSAGRAIGGIGVGVWAADNTEMFYDKSIKIDDILRNLLYVQAQIERECEVRIGIGVHYQRFLQIGNGMYGKQADWLEELAEEETEGGEIVISNTVYKRLSSPDYYKISERKDLKTGLSRVFRFNKREETILDYPKIVDFDYPLPFSKKLQKDLEAYFLNPSTSFIKDLRKKYLKRKTVVLIKFKTDAEVYSWAGILNGLISYMAVSRVSMQLMNKYEGKNIKISRDLGIYVFSESQEALDFSQEVRSALRKELDIECAIGIDEGEVLVSKMSNGKCDIAGVPVNISSKMAEDKGELGKIYATKKVYESISSKKEWNPITFSVSGVEIEGYEG